MKISLEWLADFIDLTEDDPRKIAEVLTERSAEIEGVIEPGRAFDHVVTGKILEIAPHPDADRVRVTKIDVGDGEPRQIICGAKNIETGQIVPTALPGAVLPGDFTIEKRKMRGVTSEGMLCSGKELGLSEDAQGIMILDSGLSPGIPFAEVMGLTGAVLDIDNTAITNRPDLFSHYGFARELVATGLARWKRKEFDFAEIEHRLPDAPLPVTFAVQQPEICPARADIVMAGIKVAQSPDWIKSRLQACGIRPINNIVDISNYVMLELGMPLHIFDLDRIEGDKITMRLSRAGETVTTLDSVQHSLPADVIVQEDAQGIFDLAGIMGGENSEIVPETTKILVHVPVYDPVLIRKAALSLAHRTDASTIYEKRVPNASVLPGIKRTIELLMQLCPEAHFESGIEFVENLQTEPKTIALPVRLITRMLGEALPNKEICDILARLDFAVEPENEDSLRVTVPLHRCGDIDIAEDLAEEVARIHGLNTLHAKAPVITMRQAPLAPIRKIRRTASDFLTGQGFYECLNFAFCGEDLLKKCGIITDESHILLENPISADMSIMRQSLLPRLLEKAAENRRHTDTFRLFEIGKTFFRQSATEKTEMTELTVLLVGEDYLVAKGILEQLFRRFNIAFRLTEAKEPTSAGDCGASILLGNTEIGQIFSVKRTIRENFDLPENCSAFFFDLSTLAEVPRVQKTIQKVPRFPHIHIDLSVLADTGVYVDDILKATKNCDSLVESAEILEIFEGKGVPAGKKSVTVRYVFRAPDRTLSSEEAESVKQRLLQKLDRAGFPYRF